MKTALITGISGQDGSYLAEYLLGLGYRVVGLVRRDTNVLTNLSAVKDKIIFQSGDLRDFLSLNTVIQKYRPDEIYNLGSQSFIPPSWFRSDKTFDTNVGGLARILEIVEQILPSAKVYQATSSEMYGEVDGACNEETIPHPASPYGVSKLAAHILCRTYRERGIFVVSGILFNHESPRRGSEFVTAKISNHVAQWVVDSSFKTPIRLGNLHAERDWGYAKDYVEAMHRMLQLSEPDDFVIGTGEPHTVEDFLREAISAASLGDEYLSYVVEDKELIRRSEIMMMEADYTKANVTFGWKPKTSFRDLVDIMVAAAVERIGIKK